jgi:7-cyano-7-deazaguanine synthase
MESVVLLSGGLDSAVLLAHEVQRARVHPVYVSVGLAWEGAELAGLRELVTAPVFDDRVEPLATLEFSMRDILAPSHWAIRGAPPAYDTPDEDVYLPGRNVVLVTKAAVLAVSRGCRRVTLGTLANNPFPDATAHFFEAMSRALSLGLGQLVEIVAPLAQMRKEDVIRLGDSLDVPLELTLSCMNPVGRDRPVHCGLCSKCRERRDAFAAASVVDRTAYAHPVPRN